MHSEISSKQSHKATHHGFAVSGSANNTRRRRVSGWVLKKLQKGAWPQKPVKQAKAARAGFRRFFAAPTPSAALAHQLGKFPPSAALAHQLGKFPTSAALAHQLGKFPTSTTLANQLG